MASLRPIVFDERSKNRRNGVHRTYLEPRFMAKPHRQLKKANHGKRPANAKARKAKRRMIKT
jgi:hypothetical protein